MQSHNDAPVNAFKKLSVAERNCQMKGKENCLTSLSRLQPNKQKQPVQNAVPQGPQKSKIPVLSKSRAPPDFQKMHQNWQTNFQKGKAVCKKSCTRPQPFNFSQRGERPRVQKTEVKNYGASSSGQSSCNSPPSHRSREPLAEVLSQNKKESSVEKSGSEADFKADPASLASILSNIGVSAVPVGKVSLAQRVPIRAESIAHPMDSSRNPMIRSSVYAGPANRERMSCFANMTVKANEQKPLLRPQNKTALPENTVKEPAELKKEKLHEQENPVLQQMKPPPHVPTSDKSSCSHPTQEESLAKRTPLPAITDETSTVLSTPLSNTSATKFKGSREKKDSVKRDTNSVDFVADSQALASILSNTEMNNNSCGKLSPAQRVPIQGRSSMFKGAKSGTFMMQTTPKHANGPVSNVTVPLKDVTFSPCRVPLVTSEKSSGESARRVLQPQSFSVRFSQAYSITSKQPVFPKTPKALALEKANKCHEADKTEIQTSSKSTVKWADELSPSPLSKVVCENEPDLEEVAVRLFLDGEGPGDPEKKKEPTALSAPVKSESLPASTPQQKELVQPEAHENNAGNFALHSQLHIASLSQPSDSSPRIVPCVKPTVPLSFLSHPAVKAVQSCTLGKI
uniref:Uncharacterized protein n=1 Tax=Pyxicephalus adspersus TaxID=30357 RepID=A0AAV3AYK8_PYXAD|nr:TPA: hypothetical protein GDO54_000688 [Pyxicephalus adspersus]